MNENITLELLSEVSNERFPMTTTFDWHGISIECKTRISFAEMTYIVKQVSELAFDEDGESYQNLEFSKRMAIIKAYTNIDLYDDISDTYDFVIGTDFYDELVKNVNGDQIYDINLSIKNNIDYVIDTKAGEVALMMSKFSNAIDNLGHDFSEVFNGVSNEDILNMVQNLTNHEITEEGLIKAIRS